MLHVQWVPLTTNQKIQKKLIVVCEVLVEIKHRNVVVNDLGAKIPVCCNRTERGSVYCNASLTCCAGR